MLGVPARGLGALVLPLKHVTRAIETALQYSTVLSAVLMFLFSVEVSRLATLATLATALGKLCRRY